MYNVYFLSMVKHCTCLSNGLDPGQDTMYVLLAYQIGKNRKWMCITKYAVTKEATFGSFIC